jgi:hypothetical protein
MDVSSQLHARLLSPKQEFRFPLTRRLGGREQSLDSAKIRTPEFAIHVLVTIPTTELFRDDIYFQVGRDSSVGKATRYGLDGPASNPGGATFSATVHTGPGAQTASCTMGIGSLSRAKPVRAWCRPPNPI